ncbi:hypothetical protein CspeluHIS016_0205660 [Cutaneotrichosporon spelunceum]|uniref:Uncharacterized protein n=1 Tax=Cutaneotrichosporon spelunceum TaxID=1672016 RepID=A0AAD3TSA2_9TREE|nr:hypothetical protein CspeluHIS016_0205660 [Cutaneotrichosporon spelunceum]
MPHRDFSSLVEARAYTYGEAKGMRSALALLRAEQSFLTAVHSHPAWAVILSNIVGKAKGLEAAAGRMRCHCGHPQHELCRCPAAKGSVATGNASISTGAAKDVVSFTTGVAKGNICFSTVAARSNGSFTTAATKGTVGLATGATLIRSPSLVSISSTDSSSTSRTHEKNDSMSLIIDDLPPGPNGLSVKPVKDSKAKSKDGKGKSKKGKSSKAGKQGKGCKEGTKTIILGLEHDVPRNVLIPGPNETVAVRGTGHSIQNADVSVSTGVSVALGGSMGAVGPSIAFKHGEHGEVTSVLGPSTHQSHAVSVTPKPMAPNDHETFGVEGHAAGITGFTHHRNDSVLSSASVDLEDWEPYIRVPTRVAYPRSTVAPVSSVTSSPVAPKYPDIHPIIPDHTGAPVLSVPPTPVAGGFIPTPLAPPCTPSPCPENGGSSSPPSSSSSVSSKSDTDKLWSNTSAAKPALPDVLGSVAMALPDKLHAPAALQTSGGAEIFKKIAAQGISLIQKYTGENSEKATVEVVQNVGIYGADYKPPGAPGSYVHPGYGIHPSPSTVPAALPSQPVPVSTVPSFMAVPSFSAVLSFTAELTFIAALKFTPAPGAQAHTGARPSPGLVHVAASYSPHLASRPPMDAPTLGNSHFYQVADGNLYEMALAHPLPPSHSSGASTVDDEPLDDVLERLTFEEQQYIASLFSGNEDPSRAHHVLSDQALHIISSMSHSRFHQSAKVETEDECDVVEDVEEKEVPKGNKPKDKKKRKTNTNRKPKRERLLTLLPFPPRICASPGAEHVYPPPSGRQHHFVALQRTTSPPTLFSLVP